MEILFISHKYPPATGGMEKQSFELINGMKQLAVVHSIVYEGRGSLLIFFLTLSRKIKKICKANPGITMVHYNDGLMAAFCLLHSGYRHLHRSVTLHGLDVVFPSQLYRRYVLPAFNRFQLIIAVSKPTAEACIRLGISPARLVVVRNGVDASLATATGSSTLQDILLRHGIDASGKTILVSMGRPVKRKGFSWLIKNVLPRLQGNFLYLMIGPYHTSATLFEKILNALPATLSNKIALFAGYPSDESTIRNLAGMPAYKDKLIHLGKLPFDEIISLLSASNAFVMPNIYVAGDMEGFGLVCLEACLCGATVFASDADGIKDAIHDEKNGYLLPAGNADEWVKQLNQLIATPQKFTLDKLQVKEYTISNFNWQKMVQEYYVHFKNSVAFGEG